MNELETLDRIVNDFDASCAMLTKYAFTPTAAPAPPMTAMPPGAMPPPGMDPNAMPPGAMPPPGMDPNAMPPQGDPNTQGGNPIPPQLEGLLSEMANGVQGLSQAMEEQQSTVDQLSQRMLALEEQQSSLRDELKSPAPFGGGNTKPTAPMHNAAPKPHTSALAAMVQSGQPNM